MRFLPLRRSIFTRLFILLAFYSLFFPTWVYGAGKPFIHPDFLYSHQLQEKHTLSSQTNINHASFEELKILPGIDDNLALKLIRLRKTQTFQSNLDLYRLPFMEKREIDRLISQLQQYISF